MYLCAEVGVWFLAFDLMNKKKDRTLSVCNCLESVCITMDLSQFAEIVVLKWRILKDKGMALPTQPICAQHSDALYLAIFHNLSETM